MPAKMGSPPRNAAGCHCAGMTLERLRLLQLHAERHPARPAARAGHRHEDALSLLLVDVGALQHIAGLLFEQVVKGQIADADGVNIADCGRCVGFGRPLPHPGRGRPGPPSFSACPRQGEISSSTRDLVSVANKATMTHAPSATRPNTRKAPPMLPLPTVLPKTCGPRMEARRSHAVPVEVPSARTRVG